MDTQQLLHYLDHPQEAREWLRSWGLDDPDRGHANLVSLANSRLTLDLLWEVCAQLSRHLPQASDPDRALNNLEQFVAAARNPLSLCALFERDLEALPTLLQIFSTSQYLADSLIRDPEAFDLLRLTDGQPVGREVLVDEICSELRTAASDAAVMDVLRRYKRRETLRIAYGDIVRGQRIDTVTRQISILAEAICEGAILAARQKLDERHGPPQSAAGAPRFVALGLGKLGGLELNYSSDIDLVFLSDGEGKTHGQRPVSNQEYFERLARQVTKYLSEATATGTAYRVDLRLRPEGSQGPVVISKSAALRYYDVSGRTWERQAFVKARAVAGDLELGHEFLAALEPWIYRRYLSRADITGIKALKRRIEQRTRREGEDERNVKTGHGGIRDIEFVIQFLQLLNGGDLPDVRTGNTLQGIARLEQAGCLTMQERSILEENYALLRKIEHRLQILFDLQTHTLPEDDAELRRLALRTGYRNVNGTSALEAFQQDFRETTALNRRILDHLLHDAFGEDQAAPETDLVLDPHPAEEMITATLQPYRFTDIPAAYENLMALGQERISFLSTRRCRHFLASIAPRLLEAIAQTPDPDSTLINLSKVSDSLGGKGVLWELFSFNPPSLQLYVQVCASSPYLSSILTSNPGMIDELMDSLLLDRLPALEPLTRALDELCRGAEDVEPILHSFKNAQHLSVGVRDILGKDDLQATHAALSDIAEVCLANITRREYQRCVERHGAPLLDDGPRPGAACELVVLAMGKLGGREPNYHSDLDVIFLFAGEGRTAPGRRGEATSNQHFFSQLGQRIIKEMTHLGPYGRLYELDPRLRPTGKSGSLAISLQELQRYFLEGHGQLWERQALCKARPVYGSPEVRCLATQIVRDIITAVPWSGGQAAEIFQMRKRLEETASPLNLKRGAGGTVDIEFLVQALQLKHAAHCLDVLTPGTIDAIAALRQAGALSADDADYWARSYRFLRSIESGLRLMNTTARHDLPESEDELNKLAFLLGRSSPAEVRTSCDEYRRENRRRFDQAFAALTHDP